MDARSGIHNRSYRDAGMEGAGQGVSRTAPQRNTALQNTCAIDVDTGSRRQPRGTQQIPRPDSYRPRKRSEREGDEERPREAIKRPRPFNNTNAVERTPDPRIVELESHPFTSNNYDSPLRQSSPPPTFQCWDPVQQHNAGAPSIRSSRKLTFGLRDFPRREPVLDLSEFVLRQVVEPQCMDDLLNIAPYKMFDVSWEIIEGFYHSLDCYENLKFMQDTRIGSDEVGEIGLFVIPQLRGDPRPPSLDNYLVLPGPHGTKVMFKMTPALIINNENREHINIKLFTTKHNTDPEKLYNSGELKRDFVLMRRTNGRQQLETGTCLASLDFEGTSKSYPYKDPCYMEIDSNYQYPRHCPWMRLGHLARDSRNDNILDNVLTEASNRLASPVQRKFGRLAANTLASPSSSSPGAQATPALSTTTRPTQSNAHDLDSIVSKDRPLPVNPDAEPQRSRNTFTTTLPYSISDLTILACIRKNGVTPEQFAEMKDEEVRRLAELQESASTDAAEDNLNMNSDSKTTDLLAQEHKGSNTS